MKLRLHRNQKFYGLFVYQLGFVPSNESIYRLALLHKSASQITKGGRVLNYERLEFLGDAVLGAIITEILYKYFPNRDEGFLTRLRSKIVSRESLNALAITLGLDKEVIAKSDISRNKHIYGDVFEAFIGAIFLDQGFENTRKFITNFIFPNYFDIKSLIEVDTNYKSRLIEWGQKNKVDLIFLTNEVKSRRANFKCDISIDEKVKGSGSGLSKKEAEQKAAKSVIETLKLEIG
ncbi:MAG: ribonuclease III [Marinifilaceae bacterium]